MEAPDNRLNPMFAVLFVVLFFYFFSKRADKSFKNAAGYYLIENSNGNVIGTKDLSKCMTRGEWF